MADKKKVIESIVKILNDPVNEGDHVANVAEQIFDTVTSAIWKGSIAVIGQIQPDGEDGPFPVVLGPFTARGKLDSEEKWREAAKSHTTSRSAGGGLSWHTVFGTGRGRYTLAPVFKDARSAWAFYQASRPEVEEEVQEIFSTIRGSEINVGPTCLCGFNGAECHAHPKGEK